MTSRLSSVLTHGWGDMTEFMRNYITDYSFCNYKDPVEGWNCGSEHPVWGGSLVLLCEHLKPKHALEVGYQTGAATIPLAYWCHKNNASFMAFDSHEDSGSGPAQDLLIERFLGCHIPGDFLDLRQERFEPSLHTPKESGAKWDFVMMDHHKPMLLNHIVGMIKHNTVTDDCVFVIHDIDIFDETIWEPIKKQAPSLGLTCTSMKEGRYGVICCNAGLIERA